MSDMKKILAYLRSIPCDEFHLISKYAPNDPLKFISYVRMLPKGCYKIEGNKFMIVGLL